MFQVTPNSFPNLSLYDLFLNAARKNPDKDFVVFKERRISYREMFVRAEKLASAMQRYGIHHGGRVGVLLPNWPEFVEIYLATAKLGAILVPISTRIGVIELELILKSSDIQLLFFSPNIGGLNAVLMLEEMRNNLHKVEQIFAITHDSSVSKQPFPEYESLISMDSAVLFPEAKVNPVEDVAMILYTSGTTSVPKGVLLTHRNIVWTAINENLALRVNRADRFLIVVPFFHVFGAVVGIACVIAAEATMCIMDEFKAENVLNAVQREKISVLHGTPTMFILELNSASLPKMKMKGLRTGIIAGAPCPEALVEEVYEKMHCDLAISYGLTETSPAITITDFNDPPRLRHSTVGKALPGIELKLVDENRKTISSTESVGELACRGYAVMKGYDKRPDLTKDVIDDQGWFYTGDMAAIDARGAVKIVGRKKELIKRGGFSIFPSDIENVLQTHPMVQESAVIGFPDRVLGEKTQAFIVLKDGSSPNDEEIRRFLVGKISDYKIPDKIKFVFSLPMTPSGKVFKEKLKNQIEGCREERPE